MTDYPGLFVPATRSYDSVEALGLLEYELDLIGRSTTREPDQVVSANGDVLSFVVTGVEPDHPTVGAICPLVSVEPDDSHHDCEQWPCYGIRQDGSPCAYADVPGTHCAELHVKGYRWCPDGDDADLDPVRGYPPTLTKHVTKEGR